MRNYIIYKNSTISYGGTYKIIFCCLFISINYVVGICQSNIGIPFVTNYEKKDYRGGTQTWDIDQDEYGRMYFANNDGLLIFDGSTWQKYSMPNKSITRSVCVIADKIYVGGQNELGFLSSDERGRLEYHSILHLIPEEHQHFTDVWDIIGHDGRVFFRTRNKILVLANDTIAVYPTESPLLYMGLVDGTIYVQDQRSGLMRYQKGKLVSLQGGNHYIDMEIRDILSLDNGLLVCTDRNGIILLKSGQSSIWHESNQHFFKTNRIYCVQKILGGDIAIGTTLAGLIIVNSSGEIIQQLTSENGMQSGTVLSILTDQYHNIWVGLNNGIDYIKVSSPFYQILPDGKLKGTGYAVKIFDNKIYFGTSNGLFFKDWKNQYTKGEQSIFQSIENSSGQVWSLNEIDGSLLMGHHYGGFEIKDNKAIQFSTIQGGWTFKSIEKNVALQGNYSGIGLCKKNGNTWQFIKQFDSFKESARFISKSKDEDYWISHPYRGIFRIQLNHNDHNLEKVDLFGSNAGLPSQFLNSTFEIGGDVVFSGEYGIYDFNESSNKFELNESFTNYFDDFDHVKKLHEDARGNIWYILDDRVGFINIAKKGLELEINDSFFPELSDKLVGGFEMIYPYDAENIFFGSEKGFIHFSPDKIEHYNTDIDLNITAFYLTSQKDSLISATHKVNRTISAFNHNENSFRFHYAAPFYPDLNQVQYQTYLEGLDTKWSEPTQHPVKEYMQLLAGDYTFKVRAVNRNGSTSSVKQISFEITPPWYQSIWAYVLYTLAILALIAGIILIPRSRFKKEKQIIEEKQAQKEVSYQRELQEAEKEVIQARNEILQAEIKTQTSTLASITMQLVQKNELLSQIRQNLADVAKQSRDNESAKKLKKLIRLLAHDDHLDKDWELFTMYFDQVHNNFFSRLRKKYPQLTPKDRKLCAYLRMNLTTKEIAPLMNISVRGVEISRYRLRKKLNLDSSENLTEFMIRF